METALSEGGEKGAARRDLCGLVVCVCKPVILLPDALRAASALRLRRQSGSWGGKGEKCPQREGERGEKVAP